MSSTSSKKIISPSAKPPQETKKYESTTKAKSSISQFPDLIVLKDCASQTSLSYPSRHSKKDWLSIFGKFGLLAIFVYFVVCFSLIISPKFQSALIYLHFVRWPLGNLTSSRFGLFQSRDIEILTDDGCAIRGWHLTNDMLGLENFLSGGNISSDKIDNFYDAQLANSERIVLYFHGNSGTRAVNFRVGFVDRLSRTLQANVVAVDYRGFGDSGGGRGCPAAGWPSEEGVARDALATAEWVMRRFSPCKGRSTPGTGTCASNGPPRTRPLPQLYLYGHSLGAAVALQLADYLADRHPEVVTGVILDSAFSTLADASMAHPLGKPFRLFPFVKNLMRDSLQGRYPSVVRVARVAQRTNLLLLHGSTDSDIPPAHSHRLFAAAVAAVTTAPPPPSQGIKGELSDPSPTSTPPTPPLVLRVVEVRGAGHNAVSLSAQWNTEVPRFALEAEAAAAHWPSRRPPPASPATVTTTATTGSISCV